MIKRKEISKRLNQIISLMELEPEKLIAWTWMRTKLSDLTFDLQKHHDCKPQKWQVKIYSWTNCNPSNSENRAIEKRLTELKIRPKPLTPYSIDINEKRAIYEISHTATEERILYIKITHYYALAFKYPTIKDILGRIKKRGLNYKNARYPRHYIMNSVDYDQLKSIRNIYEGDGQE